MAVITMIAQATAKPGRGDELEKLLRAAVAATHAEEGNLHYSLHRLVDDPDVFVFIEAWDSMEALGAHGETEHVKAIVAARSELMTGPPEMRILAPLTQGDSDKSSLGQRRRR